MTYLQGTDYERVVRATSDADLAAALDKLADRATAYSRAAQKVIMREIARRLRWNTEGPADRGGVMTDADRESALQVTAAAIARIAGLMDAEEARPEAEQLLDVPEVRAAAVQLLDVVRTAFHEG